MAHSDETPAALIDATIADLGDWRGALLATLRDLILRAEPGITEDVKWRKPSNSMRGVPVWSYHGIICTGETYKTYVKMTFAKGAALPDPAGLFNASLEGNTRRAIDFHEGVKVNEKALKALPGDPNQGELYQKVVRDAAEAKLTQLRKGQEP